MICYRSRPLHFHTLSVFFPFLLHITLLLSHAPHQNFTTEAPLYLKGQTRFVGIKTADLIRVSRVRFQKELEKKFLSCQSSSLTNSCWCTFLASRMIRMICWSRTDEQAILVVVDLDVDVDVGVGVDVDVDVGGRQGRDWWASNSGASAAALHLAASLLLLHKLVSHKMPLSTNVASSIAFLKDN